MRFARGGGIFIGAASAVWVATFILWQGFGGGVWGILLMVECVAGGILAWFFRDPERRPRVVIAPGTMIAPCDGRIVEARSEADGTFLAIYLNLFDLHVVRSPLGFRVDHVTHRAGAHRRASSSGTVENERVTFSGTESGRGVRIDAIAGLVARRIVPYAVPGDTLAAGDRICLIRFGSRVEFRTSNPCDLLCGVGDRVRGGVTPVARIKGRMDGR